jgi:putative photosynthetic complex assembly protein 2
MTLLLVSIAVALLAWWLSTGAVIYLDGLPRRTFPWTMVIATLLMVAGIILVAGVRDSSSVSAAYLSFLGGFLAWGWQEVSFYTGYVTGPRKHACDPGCSGWRHFGHALQVSIWHELAIVVGAVALWFAAAPGTNRVGFWAFVILWVMHESARINVFLGVRNVSEEFLPEHMRYLSSFLRQRPMNPLLPFSVLGSLVLAGVLLIMTLETAAAGPRAGLGLLTGLAVLGVVEHVFLVLPVPLDRLWTWGLRSREKGGSGRPTPERDRIPPQALSIQVTRVR